jgi:PleD family two-component response regulator
LAVANQKICAKEHLLRRTGSMGLKNALVENLDQLFVSANKHLYKANNIGRNQVTSVIR